MAEEAAASLGGGVVALPLDVTDRASFTAFVDEAERQLGPIDVLVNNAGIMPVTPLVEEADDSIRRQLDINVYGVIVGSQLAIERMRPRGTGQIVNVASSAGKVGVPGIATYSATKHAVVGLCESMRHELRGSGVEVSVVMPVLVNTALTEGISSRAGVEEVEPEDVAKEIVDALELGRFDVYVPRKLQATIVGGHLLPRRVREAVARFMGVDKVMTDSTGDRRAYEERAAASRSAADDAAAAEADGRDRGRAARRGLGTAQGVRLRTMGRIYNATWGRGFSALYDRLMKRTEEAGFRDMRRQALAPASGRTIDIGSGTGGNLGLYPDSVTELVFAEPDPHMIKRLRPKVRGAGLDAEVVEAPAEALPFEDSSFDTAVYTLVLCTVPDPAAALAETARILKPGGKLLFVEHVRSKDPGAARWQDRLGRAPGSSSPTAATATATPSPRSRPPGSPSRAPRRPSCRRPRR